MGSPGRLVIAQFSTCKTTGFLIGGVIGLIVLFWITTHHDSGSLFDSIRSTGEIWVFLVPVAWIGGIAFGLMELALLNQLVFDNRRAVWIKGDKIIYLNPLFMSVRRSEISNISNGSVGRHKSSAIVLELKNGGQKYIPIAALSEPAEPVLVRLRKAIRLSEDFTSDDR